RSRLHDTIQRKSTMAPLARPNDPTPRSSTAYTTPAARSGRRRGRAASRGSVNLPPVDETRAFDEQGHVVVRAAFDKTAFRRVRELMEMETEAAANAAVVRDVMRRLGKPDATPTCLTADELEQLTQEERDLVSGNFNRGFKGRLEFAEL